MIQPQSLDVLLGEYTEQQRVWAIRAGSGKFLAIPDQRFPGRRPIRFFTSDYDARRVRDAVLEMKPALWGRRYEVVEVALLETLRKVKADKIGLRADSFVINSSDEVFGVIAQLKERHSARNSVASHQETD
jgi:hypothetical protein